jgi:hypothetical protein
MNFTKDGVQFSDEGDVITWLWPWRRPRKDAKIRSERWQSLYFNGFKGYWKYAGRMRPTSRRTVMLTNQRVEGYHFDELLSSFRSAKYPDENIVILHDLNLEMKGSEFWNKIPKDQIEELMHDVVILHCDNPEAVEKLVRGISPKFAHAYGYRNDGRYVQPNLEEFE